MRQHNLPFETVEGSELEEVKPELIQVLHSLNQREVAAEVATGSGADMFYKACSFRRSVPP